MNPVRAVKEFLVAPPPDALWPVFSDTDRMNRAINFDPVVYDDPPEGAVTRVAHSKMLGFLPSSWNEPPYEFVAGRYYRIRRAMHGGPFLRYSFGVDLSPEAGGTRVALALEIEPRNAFFGWLAGKAAPAQLEKIAVGLGGFADSVAAGSRAVFPSARKAPRVNRTHLSKVLARMAERTEPAVLESIRSFLVSAADPDVLGMRPFALADAWKLDRVAVLRAFLHGSREGLFDLRWEILCPNCRVPKAGFSALADLDAKAHCGTCEITFDGEFDRNVEVRFSVHPSVRKAVHADFCIGSPAKASHRALQIPLGPRETRTVEATLENRRYYFRTLKGSSRRALLPHPDASASFELRAEPLDFEFRFKPGPVSLTLVNPSEEPVWAVVDREHWSDLGATAAFVTTQQDFRDLFSSEVLAPGQSVAIQNMAILFTDLKDSTATYTRIGDAKAYSLVRRHFEILIGALRAHNGGVVKTIGDAVMAAFSVADDAASAAVAIQAAIAAHNAERPPGEPEIVVKLGLHAGPAIAVTMNDLLDYFGTTVNTAARVQSTSEGGDIVLTGTVLESPGVRELLERDGGTLARFRAGLKGLADDYPLWRFTPKSATIV